MNKKPIIGVTPSHDTDKDDLSMRPTYMRAIRDAGAIPLIFPLEVSDDDFAQLVDLVDGMLFTGGPDVHPSYFGENTHINCGSVSPLRDKMELTILPMVMAEKKPILGICRGIQLLNTGLGGTLYQDIPSQTSPDFPLAHRQPFYYTNYSHTVAIEKGSKLEKISKSLEIQVNSMHHQAIKTPAPGLTVTAYSPDGLIEAVEKTDYPYFVGVQWHPEYLYPFDEAASGLFQSFVDACK